MAKITMYSTPTCGFCKMAEQYFKSKGWDYEKIDVIEHPERQQELFQKSGNFAVPVFDIGGKIIVGFDRPKIDEYVASAPMAAAV